MGYKILKRPKSGPVVEPERLYLRLVDAGIVRDVAMIAGYAPTTMPHTESMGAPIPDEVAAGMARALREEAEFLQQLAEFFGDTAANYEWGH